MNLNNIKENNGFVTQQDLAARMWKFKPPAGDYFKLDRSKGDFSVVGVVAYDVEMMPLFKIYTGNRDLYLYIQEMFHKIAESWNVPARSDEWK